MDRGKVNVRQAATAVLLTTTFVLACKGQPEQQAADGDVTARDSVPARSRTQIAPDTAAVLTSSGWRDLLIGMTRADVVAAAGEDANPDAVGGPDPETCDQFRPTSAPNGLLVMIMNGRLSRISITGDAAIKTDRGFGVGDSASAIKVAYASRAVVSPHAYQEAPAEYIAVWTVERSLPNARGIVYEIGGNGRVVRINAGDETIENVEGCL